MAQAAAAGTTIAGKEAAMALKALDSATWIEPIGELPDTPNAIITYAIALSANGRLLLPMVEP